MGTVVVLLLLGVIVFFAVRASRGHLKGQGGCCGGGDPVEMPPQKQLEGPVCDIKVMQIEGMHCQNCAASVQRAIDSIEGAACRVDLKKKRAIVRCDRPVEEELLRRAVTRLDYQVKSIQKP